MNKIYLREYKSVATFPIPFVLPALLFLIDLIWVYFSFKHQGVLEKAQIPITKNPVIFQDDRDGWLRAAYSFTYQDAIQNELWQINFWPPGQVAVITIIFFIFRNYLLVIFVHTAITLIILSYIYYLILIKANGRLKLFICASLIIGWNFSFFNLSSLSTLELCPDYLAMLVFYCGILKAIVLINGEPENIFVCSLLLATAAYMRVTYYQVILITLFVSSVLYVFNKVIRNKRIPWNALQVRKIVTVFGIAFLLIIPWIGFRATVVGNDLYHAFQLSEQGRFAMGVQWWDREYRVNHNSMFIGAGVACDLNPEKCVFFKERDAKIAKRKIEIDWGEDLDQKTKEAFKTFMGHPLDIIKIKAPVLLRGYFQKIAFSSIDDKIHMSLDRVLLIPLILISGIITIFLRKENLMYLVLYSAGLLWIMTLFVTQVEFRYFLPSISLLTFPLVDWIRSSKSFHPFARQLKNDNSQR